MGMKISKASLSTITENELLLLADIAKDRYREKLYELEEVYAYGTFRMDSELAFIIKTILFPALQDYIMVTKGFNSKPDFTLYCDELTGEDIKKIRKSFKRNVIRRERESNFMSSYVWNKYNLH